MLSLLRERENLFVVIVVRTLAVAHANARKSSKLVTTKIALYTRNGFRDSSSFENALVFIGNAIVVARVPIIRVSSTFATTIHAYAYDYRIGKVRPFAPCVISSVQYILENASELFIYTANIIISFIAQRLCYNVYHNNVVSCILLLLYVKQLYI